ncbi:Ppx/GppA phosphatase family protein [Thermogemmatispora onikobensis]|uniref:Ppx/GppA phosphatase family protein n=1 Tax=Thermogemmatispora onikobensis TaxID=732234 RepID=UPI0008536EDE|nr:CHAD domain-containing protein [Thermogemmatispora onikobensis]
MGAESRPIRAAIDIGSNTIHLVVARCWPDYLDILADELDLTRLGESVNVSGAISEEKAELAFAVIAQYVTLARRLGAETILLIATEAIRRASNRAAFLGRIEQQVGLPVALISGEAEAVLTFYGATYELYHAGRAPLDLGVVDLGGGSTELVTAHDGRITWRLSLPIGSGWLLDRYLSSDPPTRQERATARTFLQDSLRDLVIPFYPPVLVATGGSANSLWLLAERAFGLPANQRSLSAEDLAQCEGLLAALSASEIAERYGQPYKRARILPAGTLILRALLARLGLDQLLISPHGIREGALLAYERYGPAWLYRVEDQGAVGGQDRKSHEQRQTAEEAAHDDFLAYGRRLLTERLEKMLSWRRLLLKEADEEAVHKMRVASRRLRAALDAYRGYLEPVAFKKLYRRLKKTAALLGAVRDSDVLLLNLHALLTEAEAEDRPALLWLLAVLEEQRGQQVAALEEHLRELDGEALRAQLLACFAGEEC